MSVSQAGGRLWLPAEVRERGGGEKTKKRLGSFDEGGLARETMSSSRVVGRLAQALTQAQKSNIFMWVEAQEEGAFRGGRLGWCGGKVP